VLLHPGEVPTAELAGHLVAVLFAAAGPLNVADAARVLDVPVERLCEVCDFLQQDPPYGLALQRHTEQLQLITAPGSTAVVERYLGAPPPVRLSRAALEALAVIAYKQPVTRGEIDAVRGVNSDSAVATLLTRTLVAEVGRRETVGRPALLAVTPECLQYLGIASLEELPELPQREGAAVSAGPADANAPRAEEADAAEAEPAEPEALEADAVEAEAVDPEALERDVIAAEAVEPEVAEADAIEAEAVEPEAVEVDAVEAEALQVGAVEPDASEAETERA